MHLAQHPQHPQHLQHHSVRACEVFRRARAGVRNGVDLGAKRRRSPGYVEHLQRRATPFRAHERARRNASQALRQRCTRHAGEQRPQRWRSGGPGPLNGRSHSCGVNAGVATVTCRRLQAGKLSGRELHTGKIGIPALKLRGAVRCGGPGGRWLSVPRQCRAPAAPASAAAAPTRRPAPGPPHSSPSRAPGPRGRRQSAPPGRGRQSARGQTRW